ncbi:MAG TPA: ABC transporter substrate-binding protein [Stellaceae bacterium]|jgi:NitT/TauT family transport system substrate-binding protein|nr:ABC transporter substrate-binding protein [Stellaceae bacterium]
MSARHLFSFSAAAFLVGLTALAAPSHAADKLRVGKSVGTAWTFMPLDVGLHEGIFTKYGVDLEVANFGGDAKLQQALASESMDLGLGSGPSMAFVVKGAPVIAVAAFAGAPRNIGVVVAGDSPIKKVADLKGKLMAISTAGSLTEWLSKRLSAHEGWGPDGMKLVAIGDTAQQASAIKAHQVDAFMGGTETGYRMEETGNGRVLVAMDSYVPHFVTHVVFARKQLVASNPTAIANFLKGFFATIAWMKAHKNESTAITAPLLHESAAVASKTYDLQMPMLTLDGQFDPQGLELIKQSYVDLKLLDKTPSDDQMLTRQFLPVKP